MVVANNTSINKYNLSPLVRIVDWTIVGCDPKVMGIGPVQAIQKLCAKTGISLDKIDLIEVFLRLKYFLQYIFRLMKHLPHKCLL